MEVFTNLCVSPIFAISARPSAVMPVTVAVFDAAYERVGLRAAISASINPVEMSTETSRISSGSTTRTGSGV